MLRIARFIQAATVPKESLAEVVAVNKDDDQLPNGDVGVSNNPDTSTARATTAEKAAPTMATLASAIVLAAVAANARDCVIGN